MFGAFGFLALLLHAPAIPAPGVSVEWDGRPQCNEAVLVRTTLDGLLGSPRPDLSARVSVRVTGEAPEWNAAITIDSRGESTRRSVRGGPCPALAEAVALVIAVTIDPLGASATVTEAMQPVTPPDPSPTGLVPEAVAPEPDVGTLDARPERTAPAPTSPGSADAPTASRPSLRRRGSAFVSGGAAVGLVPRIGGWLGGGLALGLGGSRLELSGRHRFAARYEHPDSTASGADLTSSSARASGCWAFRSPRVTIPLCGGLEIGAFTARGFGLREARTAQSLWLAAVPHVRPSFRVTPWLGVGLAIEAPVALVRPRFAVDDFASDLLRVGPIGLGLGLSIEVIFFDEFGIFRARGSTEG